MFIRKLFEKISDKKFYKSLENKDHERMQRKLDSIHSCTFVRLPDGRTVEKKPIDRKDCIYDYNRIKNM